MSKRLIHKLEDDTLFLKTEGSFSAQELLDLFKGALSNSNLPQRFPILIDARLSKSTIPINDIKPIHDTISKWS